MAGICGFLSDYKYLAATWLPSRGCAHGPTPGALLPGVGIACQTAVTTILFELEGKGFAR